jgi:hypothetical protein
MNIPGRIRRCLPVINVLTAETSGTPGSQRFFNVHESSLYGRGFGTAAIGEFYE